MSTAGERDGAQRAQAPGYEWVALSVTTLGALLVYQVGSLFA